MKPEHYTFPQRKIRGTPAVESTKPQQLNPSSFSNLQPSEHQLTMLSAAPVRV